mgnify:CR=1 FL=1
MTRPTSSSVLAYASCLVLSGAPVLVSGCSADDQAPARPLVATASPVEASSAADQADGDPPGAEKTVTAATQAHSPRRRAFLRAGNRICGTGSAALAAIGDQVATDDEAAMVEAVADQVVPNIRAQVAQLRALGYPAGDARLLSGILDDTDDVLDAWQVDPEVAFDDTRMDDVNDRLNDYGLTRCGDS